MFAFLPGSRQSEVKHLAHTYIETAKLILRKFPDARFLVPLVSRETRTIFEKAIYDCEAQELPITLLFGHAQDAMIAADGVLVASGTATLEAALLKCPMVITYKMPALTYWLMKRKQYLPYVRLAQYPVRDASSCRNSCRKMRPPENLAQALLNLVNDKKAVAELEQIFTELHQTLRQDTAQKAAAAILPYLSMTTDAGHPPRSAAWMKQGGVRWPARSARQR